MKILIFGAKGLLGQELLDCFRKQADFDVVGCDRDLVDITDETGVAKKLAEEKPDIVINVAALINVDQCETNAEQTFKVNGEGPATILRAMKPSGLAGSTFVQISTSDVFGNDKDRFVETDTPSPVNVYGASKYEGEKNIKTEAEQSGTPYFIVRTSWLLSHNRDTFVDMAVKALKEGKTFSAVDDQFGSPSFAKDVSEALAVLLEKRKEFASGIYHLVNESERPASKYEIAKEGIGMLRLSAENLKGVSKEYILKVKRPNSAMLVNTKFPKLPAWKDALREYLLARYT